MAKKENHPPVKKVRIGPHVLTFVPSHDLFVEAESNQVGRYCGDENIIRYDETQAVTQLMDTVIHESLHGVWAQTTLDFLHDDDAPDSEGERIIASLSPRLLEFFMDNKELLRWLIGD